MINNEYIFDLTIDGNIENNIEEKLHSYVQLKSLTLKNCCIYDKDIKIISQLSELIELKFVNCIFLNKLEYLTNSNILKITFVGEEVNDYKVLSQMKRLRYISIVDNKEVELVNISEITTLSELRVLNSDFLSTKELFKIVNPILFEISGSSGILKEEIEVLKTKFNVVDNGIFFHDSVFGLCHIVL